MSAYLFEKLKGYGTRTKVENTIARIEANTNWSDFIKDYDYAQFINPYSIEDIVKNYYNNPNATTSSYANTRFLPPPPTSSPSTNGLTFIKTERLHTGNYSQFHDEKALETWYLYEDKNGNIIQTKTKQHGGKRKSRRNRKSKKSRKNFRKSNRRR
jgi:hypothetical protein